MSAVYEGVVQIFRSVLLHPILFRGLRRFMQTWVFRFMEGIFRKNMQDSEIHDLQLKLVSLARELYGIGEISFTSAEYIGAPDGNSWIPKEGRGWQALIECFADDPEFFVRISREISQGYQIVVSRYGLEYPDFSHDIFAEGRQWVFGSLLKWSGPIVEKGLLEYRDIAKIARDFERVMKESGYGFFEFAHGNVIGDHVYLSANKLPHLFGLRIVVRSGRGYYDFLRALDWLILKTDNEIADFHKIVSWMKQYLDLERFDWEEVKLVFALRCIGILGWDMLHRGDRGVGDTKKKIEILLRLIRREY